MKKIIVFSFVLAVTLMCICAVAQDRRIYQHPSLGFRFEAPPNWERVPRPEDEMIYEMMDPDSEIHVVLWYTTTEQSAPRYLVKMADMKGFQIEGKPSKIRINKRNAWLLDLPGKINGAAAHTFLVVILHGRSARHPEENALFIAQIWCPKNAFDRNRRQMKDILSGLEITEPMHISYNREAYALYPEILDQLPPVPSPYTTEEGMDIVICLMRDDRYALVPVTLENGEPQDYENSQWYNKGRQLEVDTLDFPALAKTGLHSEEELSRTDSITGMPVDEITRIGRPDRYSRAGFMSGDEDIISVLSGDNGLVGRLGSTHPEMARPLFHVFNLILAVKRDSERANVGGMLYNGKIVYLKFWGAKGWQESIFNDDVLGYWEIEIWRELDGEEEAFLTERYGHLTEDEMIELKKKLSYIHTGEMVPFYVMRYGFYEGHTAYRADPVALSFIFGLQGIEEIEVALRGGLYETLVNHFTE